MLRAKTKRKQKKGLKYLASEKKVFIGLQLADDDCPLRQRPLDDAAEERNKLVQEFVT